MARGKAEKQPFQMHPSLRQHLFSVQRYSSNTGQVQNMSTLLEVTVAWIGGTVESAYTIYSGAIHPKLLKVALGQAASFKH